MGADVMNGGGSFGGNYREYFTYCGPKDKANIVEKGGACPRCGKGILMLANESTQQYSQGMFRTFSARFYLCMECGAVYGPVSQDITSPPDYLPFDYATAVGGMGDARFTMKLTLTEERDAKLTISTDDDPLAVFYLRRESVDAWIGMLSGIRNRMVETDDD